MQVGGFFYIYLMKTWLTIPKTKIKYFIAEQKGSISEVLDFRDLFRALGSTLNTQSLNFLVVRGTQETDDLLLDEDCVLVIPKEIRTLLLFDMGKQKFDTRVGMTNVFYIPKGEFFRFKPKFNRHGAAILMITKSGQDLPNDIYNIEE